MPIDGKFAAAFVPGFFVIALAVAVFLKRGVLALEKIAKNFEKVIEKESGANNWVASIRMKDIDRAKVYKTHLGQKLRGDSNEQTQA